jgi:16S rRNA processing protein RimM
VVKAHGLGGEVVVLLETDDPERFAIGGTLYTAAGLSLQVRSRKAGEKGWRVGFVEVTNRSEAESLVGQGLFVEAQDRRTLPADEFWPDQLLGLLARDPSGREVGRVIAVADSMPQARLVVATAQGEVEIPFVDDLVPEVNVSGGYVVVAPMPGLLD